MAITRLITADDLLTMDLPPGRYDLIDGELFHMAPAGDGHGRVTMNLSLSFGTFIKSRLLGDIWAAETGFVLARDPDTVVAPDFAFARAGRIAPDRDPRGYLPLVPDVAVEAISPSDHPTLVRMKIDKYFAAGIPMLVLVYPDQRHVRVLGAGCEPTDLYEGDTLDGGDVLPGFSMLISDIFR